MRRVFLPENQGKKSEHSFLQPFYNFCDIPLYGTSLAASKTNKALFTETIQIIKFLYLLELLNNNSIHHKVTM